MKKYKVILADPPWFYNDRKQTTQEFDFQKKEYKKSSFGGGAIDHYSMMKTADICNLQIKNVTENNAVLFLWTTFPVLPEALEVIKAWNFEYKTIGFNWIKLNKNKSPFFGVGYYTRSNSELCLLGIKGKMKPKTHSISSILFTPRFKQHSRKPDIVYSYIEQLFDGPYLELFARRQKEGWDVWGNEVKSDIIL